ncbi:four helix bundle protein [Alcaligenaceae bacterium]|nr:four helix bundle protein [Alcaligenaceae bacterium]
MALHTDTQIYRSTYDLTLLATRLVANMPRNYKADFGADFRRQCFGLVRLVYKANTVGDKVRVLRDLREEVEATNLSARLAVDLRLISRGQYAQLVALLDSIGKQSTGWLKHSEHALAAPSSRRSGQRA